MNRKFEQWDNKNLMRAFRLLFSNLGDFSIESIKDLQLSSIKAAYRIKAKETHPDKSISLGVDEEILTKKFAEITDAYQSLIQYHEKNKNTIQNRFYGREGGSFRSRFARGASGGQGDRGKERSSDQGFSSSKHSYYPKNYKLLFGQFLYYSGHISFQNLLDAIVWQRRQRAQYGEIAMNWGILKNQDIINILKSRLPHEKFGETAVRIGLINPFQHTAILIKQRKKQRYIGEFFIKKGILTPNILTQLLKKQELHNNSIKLKKR